LPSRNARALSGNPCRLRADFIVSRASVWAYYSLQIDASIRPKFTANRPALRISFFSGLLHKA
jgi:hypothetical protein